MFFSKPTEYNGERLFSLEHFTLLFLTICGIIIAARYTNNQKSNILKKIRIVTITAWILEVVKIVFNLKIGNGNNLNTYIPLYYCSILLYAGLFSSFGNGFIKRMGDVFLATGGIVGGVLFLLLPTTSITMYPMYHYISIQSFLYHGAMVYLGIIVNKSNYIELNKKDIIYYSSLLLAMCIIAYIVNLKYESNLMFISQDFPGTPIGLIYKLTGKYFTLVASLIQIFGPFYTVFGLKKLIQKLLLKEETNKIYQTAN